MAKLTENDIVKWAESANGAKAKNERGNPLSQNKLTAWQLRQLGYTVEQVAQILEVGASTVSRWDGAVRKQFADLPTARIAKDRLQSLIPKALRAYDEALGCDDMRVRKDAAKDILNNFRVITERKETVDDRSRTDDELISEAERIIAGAKREVGANQPGDTSAETE
jgi:hypothetical protein